MSSSGCSKFLQDISSFKEKEITDTNPKNGESYDFIVVGAGSAGSTLAARLSEEPSVSVLLIEAGGHEESFMDVPMLALELQNLGRFNWGFKTEKSDNYCRGFQNNQCNLPLGKVMGGGSTVNFMIATRGN